MKPRQKDAGVNTSHKKGVHAVLNTTAGLRRAFLVCFWCLALWEDILLSSTAFGPLLLRLIFTLCLNCCVFVVASVCPSVCLGEIGARESTLNAPEELLIIAFLCLYQDSLPPKFWVPVNAFMSRRCLYEGRTFLMA